MNVRRPRSLLLLAGLLAALGLPGAGEAADPESQVVVVPTEAGETKTVGWTGTIDPGTNQNSNCDQPLGVSPSDVHTLDVQVPDGTYDRVRVTFEFKIVWDNASNDEILTVINPAIPAGAADEDEGDSR